MKQNISVKISLLFTLLSACSRNDVGINITPGGNSLVTRIKPPAGYLRTPIDSADTWKLFLQNLPLLNSGAQVLDYKGNPISNQSSHVAVIDYDIGTKNLLQCADAVIRLRAEYLYKQGKRDSIEFSFTSGDKYKWVDYAKGIRPVVKGNSVKFIKTVKEDSGYKSFRKYLDIVYTYAGTISLEKDLIKVSRSSELETGDVIIKAGSPGHAVIIVDKVKNSTGDCLYLLAEGYTPAQSIHVLDSKANKIMPWFKLDKAGPIVLRGRFFFSKPQIRKFE
jgi:hypothetical protein